NDADLEGALAACAAALSARCKAGEPVDLAEAVEAPDSLPGAEPLERALAKRPDVVSVELSQRSAERDAVLAGRRAIPDPTLGIGYVQDKLTISGDQPRSLFVSVSLPIPAFDRGQH